MLALVSLLCFIRAQTSSAAAAIEQSLYKVESVGDTVCPEKHITFDTFKQSAIVCATICSTLGDACRGVNFNLTSHGCHGCNTSDLASLESSEGQSRMVYLGKVKPRKPEINFVTETGFYRQATATVPSTDMAPITYATVTKVADINVLTQGDSNVSDITGSVLLPGNKLILADHDNKKVKLLNLQTSTVTSELKLASAPWKVAAITEDQVAVTLIIDMKILFVKVTSVMNLDRDINVDGRCAGIQYHNGKLFVTFNDLVSVQIMDLDGKVEQTIDCSNTFPDGLSPIAFNPGHDAFYVGGFGSVTPVVRLSIDGVVEAKYFYWQGIDFPSGIIVDPQGRVIVSGLWSNDIHLYTPDLTKIKVLVDWLPSPQSLSLCHSTGRLYVGAIDSVSVYQLS